VESGKGTVENIKFVAHWNRKVYDVILAIVGNVYPVVETFD